MLELSLRGISFSYSRSAFALRGIEASIPKNAHAAVIGPPGSGASTLLRLIAGDLRPSAGEVRIGARVVNDLRPARRPLLYVTSEIAAPLRWSVRHLLIAAVRQRTLDREDRLHEFELVVAKWHLGEFLDRRLDQLSSSERAVAGLARIELLRPAILVADRLLEHLNPSVAASLTDDFYRTLRVLGTTVVAAPASRAELGMMDLAIVLDGGRIVQTGSPGEIFDQPASEAAAAATGDVNVIPVTVHDGQVESVIGAWEAEGVAFSGSGIALARPEHFRIAAPGEESDVIIAVEEASFAGATWLIHGMLTGGIVLSVRVPAGGAMHKGKLLALRYDASRFRLLPTVERPLAPTVPTGVPPMRESR